MTRVSSPARLQRRIVSSMGRANYTTPLSPEPECRAVKNKNPANSLGLGDHFKSGRIAHADAFRFALISVWRLSALRCCTRNPHLEHQRQWRPDPVLDRVPRRYQMFDGQNHLCATFGD